jgi:hypothetical protein
VKLRRILVKAALGLACLSAVFNCAAGSQTFGVRITLHAAGPAATTPGVCTSETLSEQNGATVRVVCQSGQFVSIGPTPGAAFVGTHGGAYSYYFGSTLSGINVAGYGEFAHGAGSIASYRIFGVTEVDGRLDLLVSF